MPLMAREGRPEAPRHGGTRPPHPLLFNSCSLAASSSISSARMTAVSLTAPLSPLAMSLDQ